MAGWFAGVNLSDLKAQVTKIGADLQDGVTKLQQDLQQEAREVDHTLREAAAGVKDGGKDVMEEESRIQQETVANQLREVKILPWETTDEKKSILTQALMEKVLGLSLEASNFTTPPPTSCSYTFDLSRHVTACVRVLKIDPNLAKTHAAMVLRVPEEDFWRNYFYRVALLRLEAGLEPLSGGDFMGGSGDDEDSSGNPDTKAAAPSPSYSSSTSNSYENIPSPDPTRTPPGTAEEEEKGRSKARPCTAFPSSSSSSGVLSGAGKVNDGSKRSTERGGDGDDDAASDDAALEAAVAAELEGSLEGSFDDLGDLDPSDLGGGADGDGYLGADGEDGDEDDDDELERQIAAELGEG